MAKAQSLEELQDLIESKKSELEDLKKQRLMTELEAVENEIAELSGKAAKASKAAAPAKKAKPAATPAASASAAPKRRGRPPGSGGGKRPKNATSLKALCVELLEKNKKGLTLEEMIEKTQEAGYKSSASNYKTVVYQTLYNADEIERDKATKLYVLK